MFKKILLIYFFISFFFPLYSNNIGSDTGYKIPRFVSTKSNNVNLRIGSSTTYPMILKYTIKNIPLEVIDEYDAWRKIIDIEGNEGWIFKTLLKGDRFAIINQPYEAVTKIFNKPQGKKIGEIGKNNIVKIDKCLKEWCYVKHDLGKGWINKINLWGVYKNEEINIPFYQYLIDQIWKIN